MTTQTTEFPESLLIPGWKLIVSGQNDSGWYGAAFYNTGAPFADDPTNGEGFEVRGCKSKEDMIEQLADLINNKWGTTL